MTIYPDQPQSQERRPENVPSSIVMGVRVLEGLPLDDCETEASSQYVLSKLRIACNIFSLVHKCSNIYYRNGEWREFNVKPEYDTTSPE